MWSALMRFPETARDECHGGGNTLGLLCMHIRSYAAAD